MEHKYLYQIGTSTKVDESKAELTCPPMFQVVLINDDFTPMDFVVEILEYFFLMNQEIALQIMLRVHTYGKAACGIYSRDVAETKVFQVNEFAREHDYPLLCKVEQM